MRLWLGALLQAAFRAAARPAARAMLIADNAAGASAASAAINRDTVGSEATRPNPAGCSGSTAISARQSPPTARLIARSRRIFPGSWVASSLRHGASQPTTR